MTIFEKLAIERYPIPAKCCRLKLNVILEKRKLYIQRLNESYSNNNPAEAR
jgi:hypothetical protein